MQKYPHCSLFLVKSKEISVGLIISVVEGGGGTQSERKWPFTFFFFFKFIPLVANGNDGTQSRRDVYLLELFSCILIVLFTGGESSQIENCKCCWFFFVPPKK